MSLDATEKEKLYKKYRKDSTIINQDEVKKMDRPFTPLGKIIAILFIALCIYAVLWVTARSGHWYLLGGLMFAYLLLKEAFALCYTPYKDELTKEYKVTILITCFNENPASVVKVFENILALDYPVHEILFLDDGSSDPLALEVAKSFAEDHQDVENTPKFQVVGFEENRGKRAVMIDGFKMATGDYIFLVDSDSEILPNALTELLRPFEYDKTSSVVGNIGVLNKNENFLTKLQSILYYNAFQLGRAAQSVTGDVVICSGAFSIHKKDFIMEHIEEFDKDRLFGITVSAGDDRTLTTFSKMSGGKTRYQSTAYCETEIPNTWRKFQSQRRRWQRSAYIGSLNSIKRMFPKNLWYLFWAFAEVYFWLIATIIFIVAIMTRGFHLDIVDIILFHCIVMYKHMGFYLQYNPLRFLWVPIYSFVYALSLAFTRVHAAITIRDDGWGTRGAGKNKEKEIQETLGGKTNTPM